MFNKDEIMKQNLLLLLIVISLLSCKKETESETKQSLIQPLGVGYYWEFVDSTFSDIGTLINVDTSRLSITGNAQIAYNHTTLDLYFWSWSFNPKYIWLCNYDTKGFYFYGGKTDNGTYIYGKSLSVKYPVNINESWNNIKYSYSQIGDSSFFFISDTVSYKCEAIHEEFLTGVGPFNCYKISYSHNQNDLQYKTYLYYSLDIGYVGMIDKQNGITRFKKTLISYSLKSSNSFFKKNSEFINGKRLDNFGNIEYEPYK